MPRENGRKRRYSDVLEDPYRGPPDFMEAGVRGFLVTSIPDREEHSIDEAVKVLRKSCIKLYGGIRPIRREDASFAKGYVMVDFMDPETVIPLPHPDASKETTEMKDKQTEATTEGKQSEEMEEEAKDAVEEAEKEKPETEGKEETKEEEAKEEEGDEAKNAEKKEKEEAKKKEELQKKKREEEERAKPPLMLAPHKFKSFRTELRNIMFIKSDVVDPVIVATTAFDLIMERKPLLTDCINQLLPVQGVCDNDYKQLEIMCRRVLVPYVGEHLEEAPSFGVMLVDKMSEPGAEVLLEVVRSAIWCLNPSAWQCSPWCEPDVVIHLEIIGSKIILSAMPQYMKYRQYSPFALHEMGEGKPEDEENLLKEREEDKGKERDKDRNKDKPKNKKGKEVKGKDDSSEKKKGEAEVKEEEGKEDKPSEKENSKEGVELAAEEKEAAEQEPLEKKEKESESKKSTRSKASAEKKSKS